MPTTYNTPNGLTDIYSTAKPDDTHDITYAQTPHPSVRHIQYRAHHNDRPGTLHGKCFCEFNFYRCVTIHTTQAADPIKDIVLSLTKLADRWFPEDVRLEKSYVVVEGAIEIFVEQAYYLLMTDGSIPEEQRLVYRMKELRHAEKVVSENVHIIDQIGGEHLRKLMSSSPQLQIEMMVAYLTSAHYMEIAEDTGGMSPALWAKQLQLALPVLFHFQICSLLH
jgi:hypothetical protein